MAKQNKNQLIPLSEASKTTPYSAEYLSLLARKGRLKCVKKGKTWFTTNKDVSDYIKSLKNPSADNISKSSSNKKKQAKPKASLGDLMLLSEASEKLTDYSSEYLSLRVRQGKLKGEKLGRNWYTKKQWIQIKINQHLAYVGKNVKKCKNKSNLVCP